MNVEGRPFANVLDGVDNFVPRAIVDIALAEVPRGLMLQYGEKGQDGLDDFEVAPLALVMDDGSTRRFALWRHQGNPKHQIAIHLPLREEFQLVLTDIMTAMDVPAAAIVWMDQPAPSGSNDRLLKRSASRRS